MFDEIFHDYIWSFSLYSVVAMFREVLAKVTPTLS